jgi:hypothetical protein
MLIRIFAVLSTVQLDNNNLMSLAYNNKLKKNFMQNNFF